MLKKFKDLKMEITVNGSGFDNPTDLSIEDDGEIPICNMVFPGGIRSRYRIKGTDIVKVYIGLDELPDHAIFSGYLPPANESGFKEGRLDLIGALFKATKDQIRINNFYNLDGEELGNAILTVFRSISSLSWLTPYIEQTVPHLFVPKDELRYTSGTPKYELMKELRDLAVDAANQSHIGRYAFFVHGDGFYFRKIPDPRTAPAWLKLAYGDTLLDFDQDSGSGYVVNKIKVIGKDDVYAEFQNDHRIGVDGLLEDVPISDNGITETGNAYDIARAKVISGMIPEVPLSIDSPLLLECIPNCSVVEITGAPHGLSGKYLIKSKNISVSEGMLEVIGTVSTPVDVVSEAIASVLGLNRDLPLTNKPTGSQLA